MFNYLNLRKSWFNLGRKQLHNFFNINFFYLLYFKNLFLDFQ